MIRSVNKYLSVAARNMKRSAIREILKLLQKPEMISFAGGLPSPETFPVDDLKEIVVEVLDTHGAEALQYGTTEGDPSLRKALVGRHIQQGLNIGTENLIITTGSQQALDLIAKIFIDPGDYILCGLPSYLGGLNAFSVYGARMKGISLDEEGMRPDHLEETIIHLRDLGKKIKFIYIIPDFQNPAGVTVPESRRQRIIEIADKYDLLIIEDSPYRDIRFSGETQKMMCQLDTTGRVLTLCTFSKILSPGFRVGWVIGNPVLLERIAMAKQTADLCTSAFVQKIIARYMEKGLLEKNLTKTIALYGERCRFMTECLRKYMPADVTWTEPQGGLFLFVTLPAGTDTEIIFKKAVEHNVAFVSGSSFFCNNGGHNTLRLNFSFSDKKDIEEGIRRLASVIGDEIKSK
ncbi:MAG: PLP-dependent aminotransferase family protein [Bacteroidales bacterium]|nr:PLP-dependent aminotransferase family protein [Bacteroidales bacterium]MBN2632877.1 PLP-dependent aminotransferase family protein [Bacteroidales bacterium]